jgi:Zn-finger nucleic acid-binding protein
MSERQGIEIDYCPKCRGVWLDRGELDKIIERSAAEEARLGQPQGGQNPAQPAYTPRQSQDGDSWYGSGQGYGGHGGHGSRGGRGHRSFLGRLFDWGFPVLLESGLVAAPANA